jgi:ABC-type multidrug transport system fused ATPase/permease subunit
VKREYWKYFRVVFPYVRRFKALGAAMVGLTLVSALVALAEPWPLALLVDDVLGRSRPPRLVLSLVGTTRGHLILFAVMAGFVITGLVQVLGVLSEYITTKLDQNVAMDFRADLFAHCEQLSQGFHDDTTTGDSMYRINFEAKAVGEMSVAIPPLVQSVLTVVGMFVITYRIDAKLALLALVAVPVISYSTEYYGNHIEPRLIHVRDLECLSLTIVNDTFSMLRVISAFNRERHEHALFRKQGFEAIEARIGVTIRQTLFSLVVAMSTALGVALILGFGASDVLHHRLTAGQLLVVLAYIHSIYQPLQTISATMAAFQERLIGIRFAKELLDVEPEVQERPGAEVVTRAGGAVEFQGVSFGYHGRPDALSSVSFVAPVGAIIGVVGTTGAGKSTLVSLIPRFIDPREGVVLLDGVDIRTLTLASLREQVSVVHQEPLLFARTIEENIRYGRLDASYDEVVEAARAANAHEFILGLPQGYATKLGERGAKVSGGERQRIAMARAFLKDAPVLILDEPTSSIDLRTESVILDGLERLMQGRTTFIVAHRLSTLRRADYILVLDRGRLVEQGPREELLAAGGLFASFYSLQTGGRVTPRQSRAARRGHPPIPRWADEQQEKSHV